MNYKKIYDDLIERARCRRIYTESAERHHIIPRSLGGDDSPSNIVILTFREHFIAHLLLFKIHKNCTVPAIKMASALNRMLSPEKQSINSSTYEKVRKLWVDNHPMKSIGVRQRMVASLASYHEEHGAKKIFCACGCGDIVRRTRSESKKPEFISGHEPTKLCKCGCGAKVYGKGQFVQDSKLEFVCACGCGGIGKVSHFYKKTKNFLHGHNKPLTPEQISAKMKHALSLKSKEQLSERSKNSFHKCDQAARARAIRHGKSSLLRLWENDTIYKDFNSVDSLAITGITYAQIVYRIRKHGGILKDGRKIEYLKKYGT